MIGILQRYVLRELLKTFALTATGLTLMFGMGGGLFNLIRIEQISAGDVARLLLYFIPLVASFMLPIAALLSCALVYGRLAADNELDACKASGVNILRLLGSALGLAIVVGAGSFWLSNFVVPRLFQQINEFAQADIQDLLVGKLKDQGHLTFRDYIIYADDARKLEDDEAVRYLGEENPLKKVVLIHKAAFVEFREQDPLRTGTAEVILLVFDKTRAPMTVTARMQKVRMFDHQRLQISGLNDWDIPPQQIPGFLSGGRLRLRNLTLDELFRYHEKPAEYREIQDQVRRLRNEMTSLSYGKQVLETMRGKHSVTLRNPAGQQYRVSAKQARLNDQGTRPRLEMLDPVIEYVDGKMTRVYSASKGEAVFHASSDKQASLDTLTVNFVLRDKVKLLDRRETSKAVEQASPFEPPSLTIPMEAVPVQAEYKDLDKVMDPAASPAIPASLQHGRKKIFENLENVQRRITAAIHSRLTMSISPLVLVLLAAALGIVLRGGQALTAFGVAFVPTVVVVLVITTGRQLAENSATAPLGLATMWGAIALMAAIDTVIIFRCIRR